MMFQIGSGYIGYSQYSSLPWRVLRSACRRGGHFTQLAAQSVVGRASVQVWFLIPAASVCPALCARQTPDWTAIGSVRAVGERPNSYRRQARQQEAQTASPQFVQACCAVLWQQRRHRTAALPALFLLTACKVVAFRGLAAWLGHTRAVWLSPLAVNVMSVEQVGGAGHAASG